MRFIDEGLGSPDHREGLETKKVEFHQPDFLDVSHRVLGHNFVVGALVERYMVGERSFGNHDARCMGRSMTGQTFEGLRVDHEFFDFRVRLHQLAQARLCLQGLLQRDVQLIGN